MQGYFATHFITAGKTQLHGTEHRRLLSSLFVIRLRRSTKSSDTVDLQPVDLEEDVAGKLLNSCLAIIPTGCAITATQTSFSVRFLYTMDKSSLFLGAQPSFKSENKTDPDSATKEGSSLGKRRAADGLPDAAVATHPKKAKTSVHSALPSSSSSKLPGQYVLHSILLHNQFFRFIWHKYSSVAAKWTHSAKTQAQAYPTWIVAATDPTAPASTTRENARSSAQR